MSDVVLAEELVALGRGHDDGQRAVQEGLAGVQGLGGRLGLRGRIPQQRHGRRPARQEARAGGLHRQEGGKWTSPYALHQPLFRRITIEIWWMIMDEWYTI